MDFPSPSSDCRPANDCSDVLLFPTYNVGIRLQIYVTAAAIMPLPRESGPSRLCQVEPTSGALRLACCDKFAHAV